MIEIIGSSLNVRRIQTLDARLESGIFQVSKEEIIPTISHYRSMEGKTKTQCIFGCQEEVGCVALAVVPLPDGKVTCFLYKNKPLPHEYTPQVGAKTIILIKIIDLEFFPKRLSMNSANHDKI